MRNVFKFAEQGQKRLSNKRRDLSSGELSQIFDRYRNGVEHGELLDLIVTAYYFGVESGYRQAKADQKAKTQ